MDKALRPDRFDCLPNTAVSTKEFSNWFQNFEIYLSVLPDRGVDKLMVLTNFLSPAVYELINECTSYEIAVNVLKPAYVKTTNESNRPSPKTTSSFLDSFLAMVMCCSN